MKEHNENKIKNERYIPERHKVGAIIRTNDNIKRFELLKKAIYSLLRIDIISLVHIAIITEKERSQLKTKLIKEFGSERKRVQLKEINRGDFHTNILNNTINEQLRLGIDYSFVLSAEAFPYIKANNIKKMLDAAKNGAYAIGLIIKEYENLIKQGYISNAFSLYKNYYVNFTNIWEIKALIKNIDLEKDNFGMEEMYMVKNLLDNYGEDSVVIVEAESGNLVEPLDKDSKEWRKNVLKTKEERFREMCNILNINPQELKKKIKYMN